MDENQIQSPTAPAPAPAPMQSVMPRAEQSSAAKIWVMIALVAVLAGVTVWYFYAKQAVAPADSALSETQLAPLSTGDTTADISADLSDIPDIGAALDADAAASAQEVSGF